MAGFNGKSFKRAVSAPVWDPTVAQGAKSSQLPSINLLGNLLCGITNLLNPGSLSGTPLGQLTQILNALLALAPKTA
ncbi:MAG: hypothetical protein QOK21_1505 [Solirubrobacteraceae bacterium]|nr:hypothetical protein [Solirubrobacteraceae bacterium]